MGYKIIIEGLERELPLYEVAEDVSIAAFILPGDVEMTKRAATALLNRAPDYDILMTAEAKSIPLVYEMARQKGENEYVVARKSIKVYMKDYLAQKVETITTQREQVLYLGNEDVRRIKGKKVLLVDDVISTGESIKALESLVCRAGGEVVGKMAVLGEGNSMNREDIIILEKLPLFDGKGNIKK